MTIARLNTESASGIEFLNARDAAEGKRPFVDIPDTQFEIMTSLFECNPAVRAAFEAIERGIFAGQVILTGVRVDAVTARHVQREYVTMAISCIRDLLRFGFVMITFNRETGLPYTVPPALVRVQHRSVIGGPSEYRILPSQSTGSSINLWGAANAAQPRPYDDIIVMEKFPPDVSGHLTSPISALLSMEVFKQTMRQQAAIVWRANANPAMITVSKEASVAEETLRRDFGAIGEADALALQTADVMDRARAARERRQAEMREQMTAEINARRRGAGASDQARRALFGASLTGGGTGVLQVDPLTRVPMYGGAMGASAADDIPILPLPMNHDVRAAPTRQAPQGLAEVDETAEADVAMITGVPSAMWSGQRRTSVATNQTALVTYNATLQMWRTDLQIVMEPVLIFAFGDLRLDQLRAYARSGGNLDDMGKEDSDSEREGEGGDDAGEDAKAQAGPPKAKGADGARDAHDRALEAATREGAAAGASEGARQAVAEREKVRERNRPTADGGKQRRTGKRSASPVGRGGGASAAQKKKKRGQLLPNEKLGITFPAMLDQVTIERLHEIGAIEWTTAMDLMSSYLGIDRALLTDKQLEATTGRPLAAETLKARKREEEAADIDLDAKEQQMKLDAKAAKEATAAAKTAPKPGAGASKPAAAAGGGEKKKSGASEEEKKKAPKPAPKKHKAKPDSKSEDSDDTDDSSDDDDDNGNGNKKGAKVPRKKRPAETKSAETKTGAKVDRAKNPGK